MSSNGPKTFNPAVVHLPGHLRTGGEIRALTVWVGVGACGGRVGCLVGVLYKDIFRRKL